MAEMHPFFTLTSRMIIMKTASFVFLNTYYICIIAYLNSFILLTTFMLNCVKNGKRTYFFPILFHCKTVCDSHMQGQNVRINIWISECFLPFPVMFYIVNICYRVRVSARFLRQSVSGGSIQYIFLGLPSFSCIGFNTRLCYSDLLST